MTRRQKNILFWILQTGGWSLYAFVYFFLFRKHGERDDLSEKLLFLLTYFVGFLTTLALRYFFRFPRRKIRKGTWLVISILVSLIVACFIWYGLDIWISLKFWDPVRAEAFRLKYTAMQLLRASIANFIPLLAWGTLYFGITYWLEWQHQKKQTEEALHLAQKSQLEMLRYQLNPHFLFNSLNSARALIDEDPKAAREMITELSEFLRYSLIDKDLAFRPLREELRVLQHYLSIEKKRFENQLLIDYQIDPSAEDKSILSFLIHPLIENAIKYGMRTSETPLRLCISASLENNMLIIRICNSGRWIEPDQHDQESGNGTGTGLTNVRKRLENAYPGHYFFHIDKEPDQVCIIIGIHEHHEETGSDKGADH